MEEQWQVDRARLGNCSNNTLTGPNGDSPRKPNDPSAGSKNGVNGSTKPIPMTQTH